MGRKTDKNNDGRKRPLTWVEIEEKYRKLSCGKIPFSVSKT